MRLLIALTVALLALPGAAQGATVAVEGGEIVYRSDPGENDRVYFQDDVFTALGAPIRIGPGCRVTKLGIDCAGKDVTAVRIVAGDGDDWIAFKGSHTVIADLGAGDDELRGKYATVLVSAGEGDDRVNIGNAAGMIDLGPGRDRFDVDVHLAQAFEEYSPPLRVNGGDGDDRLVLRGRSTNITLSGGAGNDHIMAGEAQSHAPVDITCGTGADVVVHSRFDHPGDGCAPHLEGISPGTVSRTFREGSLNRRATGSVTFDRRVRTFFRPRGTAARGVFSAHRGSLKVSVSPTRAGTRWLRRHPHLPVFVTIRTRTGNDRGVVTFASKLG